MIAAGASLILLFSVYFITLPKRVSFDMTKTDRILEFRSAYFSGREAGKKVWEFYAERGWSGKNNDVTYLEGVSRGKFYNDGDTIVFNLKAPSLRAWRQSKVVEAFNFSATVAFTPRGKRRYASLAADSILYDPNNKTSTISGKIILKDKGSRLSADKMVIDHKKEMASAKGKIIVTRNDLSLSGEALEYFAKEERIDARGKIKSEIKGKPDPTLINCGYMELFADPEKDILAGGSPEVFQGKKIVVCDNLIYNKAGNRIALSGSVKAIIEKARAVLKEETAGKLKSEEAKKLLYEKTFLNSDKLELSTNNGDAKAYGNVTVTQKNRVAKADEAAYSEKTETINLSGNVYLKKENQWIKCRTILVSVKDETFDAVGSVEAEFRIRK